MRIFYAIVVILVVIAATEVNGQKDKDFAEERKMIQNFLCRYVGVCPSPSNPNHMIIACANSNSTFHEWNTNICCKWTPATDQDSIIYNIFYSICPLAPFLTILLIVLAFLGLLCYCLIKVALVLLGVVALSHLILVIIWVSKALLG